jgi:hypothetical protein
MEGFTPGRMVALADNIRTIVEQQDIQSIGTPSSHASAKGRDSCVTSGAEDSRPDTTAPCDE